MTGLFHVKGPARGGALTGAQRNWGRYGLGTETSKSRRKHYRYGHPTAGRRQRHRRSSHRVYLRVLYGQGGPLTPDRCRTRRDGRRRRRRPAGNELYLDRFLNAAFGRCHRLALRQRRRQRGGEHPARIGGG
jgi:hypothetical protein